MAYTKEISFEKLLTRVNDKEICDKLEVLFTTAALLDYRVVVEDIPLTSANMLFFNLKDKYWPVFLLEFSFSRRDDMLMKIACEDTSRHYYEDKIIEVEGNHLTNSLNKPLYYLFKKFVND